MTIKHRIVDLRLVGLLALLLTVACTSATPMPSNELVLAQELSVYGWEGYMPQAILDAFTAEYGVAIRYVVYGASEEATAAIRRGEVYDVVVLDNVEVQIAAQEMILAKLDQRRLSNFDQIANNFRDLAFDPQNQYSVPFQWGTSGLLYRTDLVDPPPTAWADLLDPEGTNKIGLWDDYRDGVGLTLKSLGYSYNSEDANELAEAGERLMELQENTVLLDPLTASGVPYLLENKAQIVMGWAFDMQVAEAERANIAYVLPAEGTIIWMDNLVIPANSPHQSTAELFIDFLLRPTIAAQLANEMYIAVPNEGAYPYILPEVLNNPLIFPTTEDLAKAEFYTPISPEAQAIYQEIWARFSAGIQ